MGDKSHIEWTDATWNPATGCSKVSSGCKHCYAEWTAQRQRDRGIPKYANGFLYTEHAKTLEDPLKWKSPKRIFVNSMSDMFHENATENFLERQFEIMKMADWHVYQILTKRPERMREYMAKHYPGDPPGNVWLGTSVENEDVLSRLDILRKVNASIRFVSFEPLLGPIEKVNLDGIHWAIIGGESGRHHRKCEVDWIRDLIRECKEQNVAVFFKQYGGPYPGGNRVIDGRQWSEYPAPVAGTILAKGQTTLV